MLIDDSLLFEKKYSIIVNNLEDQLLYYFDYDERSDSDNMEFQQFHVFYEIMIFLGTEGDYLFEGNLYHIVYGDIVVIPPYLLHKTIYARNGQFSKRIIIDFMYPDQMVNERTGYDELLSIFDVKDHVFRFSEGERLEIFNKLNAIWEYAHHPGFDCENIVDQLMIHNRFTEFLYAVYALKDRNVYTNEMVIPNIEQKMHSVAAYIHQHYGEPLSLQSLADQFYINPYYLSHSFRETMNFTLSDYIQMTRIKNAQYKLITTNDKISDIAISCGFNSFSQFNRVFRKFNDMSPREYRRNSSAVMECGI